MTQVRQQVRITLLLRQMKQLSGQTPRTLAEEQRLILLKRKLQQLDHIH